MSQVIQNKEITQQIRQHEKMRSYLTDNRITLIAYQAQFMRSRRNRNSQNDCQQVEENQTRNKKSGKTNVNLEYESAFLNVSLESSQNINLKKLVQKYDNLNQLWVENQQDSQKKLKQFLNLMLQLKHSVIVQEFCNIYNESLQNINHVLHSQIKKQTDRFQKLEEIKDTIIQFIKSNRKIFIYFTTYLQQTPIETQKLILVTIYCILAQKFNFHVNQFYCDAFDTSKLGGQTSKKVKKY